MTATLPHEDWLLEAHLSDGSVLEVTEDHRFWSVTDTAWVELQDLDTTDVLLTPDGATVTVDYLDWNAGADGPAWDLTVEDEHNFFVAADQSAQPVLVHNTNGAWWCGIEVPAEIADGLVSVVLTPGQADSIRSRAMSRLLPDERVDLARGIASSADPQLAAVRAATFTELAVRATQTRQVDGVLSAADFEDAVGRIDDLYENLVDSGFAGTPIGFTSAAAWDDAAALIRVTFDEPDLVVGVRGSAVTGLSFIRGPVGSDVGDIDIFIVSDAAYQQGIRTGARPKDGALPVGDTAKVPEWNELQNEILDRFVDRDAYPAPDFKTSIRIFSEEGFARVQTGWEVVN